MSRRLCCVLSVMAALFVPACDGKTRPAAQTPDAGPTLGEGEIPLRMAQVCPGDANCPDQGDGKLYVGVGIRDVTPTIEPFTDVNGNGLFDYNEPYVDLNGNGQFDAYWMANDTGREIYGVHDPLWMRCYALRYNATTWVALNEEWHSAFICHRCSRVGSRAYGSTRPGTTRRSASARPISRRRTTPARPSPRLSSLVPWKDSCPIRRSGPAMPTDAGLVGQARIQRGR